MYQIESSCDDALIETEVIALCTAEKKIWRKYA